MKNKKYNELVILYQTKGLHKKGLSSMLFARSAFPFCIYKQFCKPLFFGLKHSFLVDLDVFNPITIDE